MVSRRLLFPLIVAAAFLTACGSAGVPPTCGAEICVTDVRMIRVDGADVALIFETTAPDGSIDETSPPAFSDGLHIRLVDQGGANGLERRLVDLDAGAGDFTCVAGTNIPGAEGRLAAACLLTLRASDFSSLPAGGDEVVLTFYSETFPTVLWRMMFPEG